VGIGLNSKKKHWPFAAVFLAVASGCVTVVKDTKQFKYEVSLTVAGEPMVLSSTNTCVLDNESFSERGPRWQVLPENGFVGGHADPIALGTSASGIKLQARPKGIVLDDDYCDASNSSNPRRSLASRVYFRQPLSDLAYGSVDTGRDVQTDFGKISVSSATITQVSSGHSLTSPHPVHEARGALYFHSIDVEFRSVGAVPGLLSYLASERRLWVGEGAQIPFDAAALHDLIQGSPLSNALWPYTVAADSELPLQKSTSWHPGPFQEWRVGSAHDRLGPADSSAVLSTEWVELENSRIELPIAEYAWRFIYDAKKSEVVVLRVEQVPLVNQ
jgi:hypothetical protein